MTRPGSTAVDDLDDEQLMAFLDGELPPKEAREVEARLAASPEAQRRMAALTQLSGVVKGHYEQRIDDALPDLAGAWASLEARLDAPEPVPAVSVEALVPAPAPAKVVPRRPTQHPQPGGWQRFVESIMPSWSHLAAGALGAAAGALLVLGMARQPMVVRIDVPAPPADLDEPVEVLASVGDTQIDSLEATGNAMVFQVPSSDDTRPATTITWVDDVDSDPTTATGGPI